MHRAYELREQVEHRAADDAEPDRALLATGHAADERGGLGGLFDQRAGAWHEGRTGGRQRHAAARALEQLRAEPRLKARERLCERRLREVNAFGGPPEVQLLAERHDDLEVTQLHAVDHVAESFEGQVRLEQSMVRPYGRAMKPDSH